MSNVTMWWAQTSWSQNAPGVSLSPAPTGLTLTGTVPGPPSAPLTLNERIYTIRVTASYWLGIDRMPPTGCEWRSLATDMTMGTITGSTLGGIEPFGPWPVTRLYLRRFHRVFSGTNIIAQNETFDTIIDIGDTDTTVSATLPLNGVFTRFATKLFDFNRNQGLAIEVELEFRIFFRGDGALTFSTVLISVPQFDIRSTL